MLVFLRVMDVSIPKRDGCYIPKCDIPKNDEFLHRQATPHAPTKNRHYNKISIVSH